MADIQLKDVNSKWSRLRVGLFCVYDSNNRILLAGTAMISDQTIVELHQSFEFFLRIYGEPPQSIITEEQ